MDIGGQRLGHIPGTSPEGDIRIPYAAIFVWWGGFHGVLRVEHFMVDRH